MPGSYTLKNALVEVGARRWPWKVGGNDKDGNPRPAHMICDIGSYDPTPIRGLTPPSRDKFTRIPIAIMLSTGNYGWCDVLFHDLLKIYGLVRPEEFNLFAIMLENHPQHLVIDLDGDRDAWPQLMGREIEIEAALRALFVEFYETQFGAAPDMRAWRADSVPAPVPQGQPSAAPGATKTSIHINHPGVAFATQRDLREFVLRFVRWIVTTHSDSILVSKGATASSLLAVADFTKVTPIDVAVYNKDRNMRLSYARKPGKQPLLPMDKSTALEDALWSSLVCYSMTPDSAAWLSYREHPECAALEPTRKRKSAGSDGAPGRPVPLPGRGAAAVVPRLQNWLIATAERPPVVTGAEFKGTLVDLPPKSTVEPVVTDGLPGAPLEPVQDRLPEKDATALGTMVELDGEDITDKVMSHAQSQIQSEAGDDTFFKHLPAPKAEDVKRIVMSLDQQKRLFGTYDTWRNVVWAVKSACPNDDGYAIVEAWTAGGKPKSKRPRSLMHTWQSGKSDRFTIASLWKWATEDMTPDARKALWKSVYPPAVMEAAKKLQMAAKKDADELKESAVAQVVQSWNQIFGKKNEQKEIMFESREVEVEEEDGEKKTITARELVVEVRHELPHRAIMNWWAKIPDDLQDRIKEDKLMTKVLVNTVLPMCNTYWKMLREKKQDRIFVKQACDQPDDDRKWRWLEMSEKRFKGAAHADFKLKGAHAPCQNMAHVWLEWNLRETYNGPACVPETARVEHKPAKYQFNTWVNLKVSHARAKNDGDANHKDWVDFLDYLRNALLDGEEDPKVKDYFCKWYFSQYVRPGYKLKVACVMYSELNQRGKGELAKMMRSLLLGDTAVAIGESEDLLDKFNEMIAGTLLNALDEFTRCKQYNERFKIEITEPTHNINGKNDKQYTEPNCSNWLVSTNEREAVDVDMFSKRVFVVEVLDGIETKLKLKDGSVKDYSVWKDRKWNAVHLAAGMLDWCKKHDLEHWDPTHIPVTKGAALQRTHGEKKHDCVAAWWRSFVTDKTRAGEATWGAWMSVKALFEIFKKDKAADRKVMLEATPDWFAERFAKRGFKKGNRRISAAWRKKTVFPEDQKMAQGFLLPSRDEAVATLNVKTREGKTEDEE